MRVMCVTQVPIVMTLRPVNRGLGRAHWDTNVHNLRWVEVTAEFFWRPELFTSCEMCWIEHESRCGPALGGSVIQGGKVNPVDWRLRQVGRGAATRACRDDIREGFLEAVSDQSVGPRRMEEEGLTAGMGGWVQGCDCTPNPYPEPTLPLSLGPCGWGRYCRAPFWNS